MRRTRPSRAAAGRTTKRPVSAVRARSWAHLTDLLYEDSWVESLGLFRSRFVFRGEPSPSIRLRTSLQRLGRFAGSIEPHLLRNFRKFAPPSEAFGDSLWNWLALAQHHGLPTRLLDWTFSPYVALHFATDVRSFETLRGDAGGDERVGGDGDGVVWCVDFRRLHEDLPPRLRRELDREKADLFTSDMLEAAVPRLEDFARLAKTRRPFAGFLDPPSLDQRLTNQFSVFSFVSDPEVELLPLLERRPETVRKVVIPTSLRIEVRDKLDQANVTERVLFPGLDGLARWLTRYYTPRREHRRRRGRFFSDARGI
jgi:FRG domain